MHRTSGKKAGAALALSLAATVALTGCTAANAGRLASSPATPSASPTVTPTQATATQQPTPTHNPGDLQPGTNHSWAAGAYVYPAADVHDWLYGAQTASPTYPKDRKIAFLTFDDGPTNTTPNVLATLKQLGVPASFFIIGGPKGLGRPGSDALLKQEIADGHSVCIHSYSHNYALLYPNRVADPAAVVADHDKAETAVRQVLGNDFLAHCQRYPGGHGWKGTKNSDVLLKAKGVYWFDWNADNADGSSPDPGTGPGRANVVIKKLKDKPQVAMILMHDFRDNQATVDSIEPVVNYLRENGYEFGVLN